MWRLQQRRPHLLCGKRTDPHPSNPPSAPSPPAANCPSPAALTWTPHTAGGAEGTSPSSVVNSKTSNIRANFENLAKEKEQEDRRKAEAERAQRMAKERQEQEEARRQLEVSQRGQRAQDLGLRACLAPYLRSRGVLGMALGSPRTLCSQGPNLSPDARPLTCPSPAPADPVLRRPPACPQSRSLCARRTPGTHSLGGGWAHRGSP